jgi:hypothetical protein
MKDFKNMAIDKFVDHFRISLASNGRDLIVKQNIPQWRACATVCVGRKAEAVEYLKAKAAAEKAEREARRPENIIAGLSELRSAIDKIAAYDAAYNRAWESGDVRYPNAPDIDLDNLKAKYPRAAAYLKAEDWSCATHYAKSVAGDKARRRILAGEDYVKVIEDMEKEWEDTFKSID